MCVAASLISCASYGTSIINIWIRYIPYLSYNTPHKYRFLPCGVTVVSLCNYLYPVGLCGIGVSKAVWVAAHHERREVPRPPPRPPPAPAAATAAAGGTG